MNKKVYSNKHYNYSGHAHELTFSCYSNRKYFNDEVSCEILMSELYKAQNEFPFLVQQASKKWTMPLRDWNPAMNRFLLEYGDRLEDD